MKKLLLLSAFVLNAAFAQEQITVVNAQGPTQSMTPQVLKIVDEANRSQRKYKFVMEFKTGAFETIGVNAIQQDPQTQIVTVTNSIIEGADRGLVNLNDYVPVFSFGDACWAVITNFGNTEQGLSSIPSSGIKEITVGGPAIGGAAHLVALQIGKKFNIPVRYIVYRSNYDALINMAGDNNSVNMVMDRLINFKQMSLKNPKIQALALNCPERIKEYSTIKTLKEQKIDSPYIWHFVLASSKMSRDKKQEIENIFKDVVLAAGKDNMFAVSDFISPVFFSQDSSTHYYKSVDTLKSYRKEYAAEIKKPN